MPRNRHICLVYFVIFPSLYGARVCRFNSITMIQDNSLAGLKKAELLMLHSNDIQHLQDEVFRDMKSLQVSKVKLQLGALLR